jgi:uncharacterized protein (TIGR03067 family)
MKQLLALSALALLLGASMGCSKTATGNAGDAKTQPVAQEDPVERDMKALQGKWAIVSMEHAGEQAPLDKLKEWDMVIVFEGNKMFAVKKGVKEERVTEIKLYPQEDPKRMEATRDAVVITATQSTATGERITDKKTEKRVEYGIYKLEGDNLTLCMNDRGKEYPKGFKTEKGAGGSVLVLQRKP